MDISSNKMAKTPRRKRRHSYEKGNLNREIGCLLRAAQKNTIRTNFRKTRIDDVQKNSKCSICGDTLNDKSNSNYKTRSTGGACGVMVIVVGNGHGDMSSNPG